MNDWILVLSVVAVVLADAVGVHQRVGHIRREMRHLVLDIATMRRELIEALKWGTND
jgi:hypothetical protein